MCAPNRVDELNADRVTSADILGAVQDIRRRLPTLPVRVDPHAAAALLAAGGLAARFSMPWLWIVVIGEQGRLNFNSARLAEGLVAAALVPDVAGFATRFTVVRQVLLQELASRVNRGIVMDWMGQTPLASLRPVSLDDRARLHQAASRLGISALRFRSLIDGRVFQ